MSDASGSTAKAKRAASLIPLLVISFLAALPARAASTPDDIDRSWAASKAELEPAGITPAMFRSLSVWSELQYHLGGCIEYWPSAKADLWLSWWEGTELARNPLGLQLLATGRAMYRKGLIAAYAEPISSSACAKIAATLLAELRTVNAAAERQLGLPASPPSQDQFDPPGNAFATPSGQTPSGQSCHTAAPKPLPSGGSADRDIAAPLRAVVSSRKGDTLRCRE